MSSEESTRIVPTPSENCLLHKKQHQLEWRPLPRAVCDFYLESGVIAAGEEHLAVHVDTFHLQNLNWCWFFFAEISIYNVKGLSIIFKPLHGIEEKWLLMQSKWKHDVHPFLVAFLLALFDHVDGVPSLVLLLFVICCWIYCHKAFIFCHYSWFVFGLP